MAALDLFFTFQFLKRLTTPFDKTDAFKQGVIDKDGKLLKSPKSAEEKAAYSSFDRLVFNLKRLLGKLPGGKSRLASYAAALLLLREEDKHLTSDGKYVIINYTDETLKAMLRENMDILKRNSAPEMLNEDAAANAAGGGAVAGIGVGQDGEPGVRLNKRRKRRKNDPRLALKTLRRAVANVHEERRLQEGGLTIFDIDDTLLQTFAEIKVVKKGKVIKSITGTQYNDYKLKRGESFDFSEFRNSRHFYDTSRPIGRMMGTAKAILKNIKKKRGSRVIILTARADFDIKELFLATFRKFGLDIDNIYVERSGNLGQGNPASQKKTIIKRYLNSNKYSRMRLFDDSKANIDMFVGLKKEYPDIDFQGYLVKHGGRTTKVTG